MSESDDDIDWSLTTWEGSRRAELRDWMKLTLTQKWTALEAMCDHARATIAWRRRRGLPYIDPDTHQLVPGKAAVVREEPPEPGQPS
ncbi:MAG: hypothetical protein WCE51_08580 [Chthoniobacterales bacterium]|jgi:hypothetical protein